MRVYKLEENFLSLSVITEIIYNKKQLVLGSKLKQKSILIKLEMEKSFSEKH